MAEIPRPFIADQFAAVTATQSRDDVKPFRRDNADEDEAVPSEPTLEN